MVNRWHKLNYLVPDPKCRMQTIAGVLTITEWLDERAQPSSIAIDNVSEEQALGQALDDEATWAIKIGEFNKILLEVNFNLENRLRTLEGANTLTKAEYITDLKDLYKSL